MLIAPDPRRLLFFASETAVLGVIAADWRFNHLAQYVEPLLPVFGLGTLGLLIASIWCRRAAPALARLGLITLILVVWWVLFVPVITAVY